MILKHITVCERCFLDINKQKSLLIKRHSPDIFIVVSICTYMYIYTRIPLTTFIPTHDNILEGKEDA
jgi:hypothetical protein